MEQSNLTINVMIWFSVRYEIDVLTLTSYLRGFTLATFVFTERTTLYFTIMTYVFLGNSISADKVFSMAQYFNILQITMAIMYPLALASAAEAAVSIKRIEVKSKSRYRVSHIFNRYAEYL